MPNQTDPPRQLSKQELDRLRAIAQMSPDDQEVMETEEVMPPLQVRDDFVAEAVKRRSCDTVAA